jgi:hypothetical protein
MFLEWTMMGLHPSSNACAKAKAMKLHVIMKFYHYVDVT